MKLKIFHLNIQKGRFIDALIPYLKKENFDILIFQEVTGGKYGFSQKLNFFKEIKKRLGCDGLLAKWAGDEKNFFGSATFFKKRFRLTNSRVLWLKRRRKPITKTLRFQDWPRSVLSVSLKAGGKQTHITNAHLAWGPTPQDKKFKLEQNRKFYNYLKTAPEPFVLTGDFNLTPDSKVVAWMERLGRNLTVENNITNTLNPRTHRINKLFPPGLAVDYIFVSKKVTVKKFRRVTSPDLSDHFGLAAELEI